jgi:dipeptidyl-peptidase-4
MKQEISVNVSGTALLVFLASLVFSLPARSQEAQRWNLEEIFNSSQFRMKSLSQVQWVDDGRKLSYFEQDSTDGTRDLVAYRVSDGGKELVIDGGTLVTSPGERPMRIGSYEWSADFSRILVTGVLHARRVKTGGNFGVYNVDTRVFRMLTRSDEEQAIINLSPDGSKIGFVRSNNLFVLDIGSGEEKQLTFDGSDTILNGIFDWVYEEEFSIIDAWSWSPDSKRIAFWRLDQSAVPLFPLVRYPAGNGHPEVELERQHGWISERTPTSTSRG